jgi:response regulator RpfG family c-di-GMP phosphodiesterase
MQPADPSDGVRHPVGEPITHDVLLVGGGFTASHALAKTIRSSGAVSVELCQRVTDAVDEAIRCCPTVILIDARDAPNDVLRVLDEFHRSPEVGAVPLLVLTTHVGAAIRDEAFLRGINDFIVEPVSSIELIARLRTHSNAYFNIVRRNRSVAAYESLQAELRHAHRAVEEFRLRLAARDGDGVEMQWKQRVSTLMQIGVELNQIHDFHTLMDRILTEARHLLRADAGTIFLREGDYLRFAFFHNETLAQRTATGDVPPISSFRLPITDRSIAGWVCLTGQSLHIPDCYAIPTDAPYRFDPSFDQVLSYRTRSAVAMPLKNQAGRILGVVEVINPLAEDGGPRADFSDGDVRLLEHFANVATVALERARLNDSVIMRMIRMAEIRDPSETGRHVERVAGYSTVIFEEWARRRGLEGSAYERQRDRLRNAARLHDIGKIGVPDAILKKPGPLTEEEFDLVKRHAEIGADLFLNDPSDFDEAAREVAMLHHEKWDGSGYPGITEDGVRRGRRGEEIPLFARIVGLADVFDALSSHRCYKQPWTEDRVIELVRSEAHRHFDPELVEILLERIAAIRAVRELHPDLPLT